MMIANHITWVVSMDSTTCRIYQYNKKPPQLILLKEFQHLENKLKDIDLTSDKPGRYKSNDGRHTVYDPPSDPKEIKINNFAREIAKELDHGRNTHAYHSLILIALPHMNGLLFQHINKHVKALITHNIEKDLIHLSDHELLPFLQKYTHYSNKS